MDCICGSTELVTHSGYCKKHYAQLREIFDDCEKQRWLLLTGGDYHLAHILCSVKRELENFHCFLDAYFATLTDDKS